MATPSSTFNSESPERFSGRPTALIGALVLVIVCDACWRLTPTPCRLGCSSGVGAYGDVRNCIDSLGAADVAVIGSSRGREAVVAPLLANLLTQDQGRVVTVRNCSLPGARAPVAMTVARDLCRTPHPPRLLVYLLSPWQLHADAWRWRQCVPFWTVADLCNHLRTDTHIGRRALLGEFAWSRIEATSALLRYRYRIRHVFMEALQGRRAVSAATGGLTTWQAYGGERSLLTRPVPPARLRAYVARLLRDGEYRFSDEMLAAVRETAAVAAAAGVPLVMAEVPVSDHLRRLLPADLMPRFHAAMATLAATGAVPWYTGTDLGLHLTESNFREQSHMNRRGAEAYTRALAERVICPALRAAPLSR